MGRLAWLLALVSASAAARPISPNVPAACASAPRWADIERCLARHANRPHAVETLHTLDDARLVRVVMGARVEVALYVRREGVWFRSHMVEVLVPGRAELLGFERLRSGWYRLDTGIAVHTNVFDGVSARRGVLSRRFARVCDATGEVCRSYMTSCDALYDGKSHFTYRGTLGRAGAHLMLFGDTSRAGLPCSPPPSQVSREPMGEPL